MLKAVCAAAQAVNDVARVVYAEIIEPKTINTGPAAARINPSTTIKPFAALFKPEIHLTKADIALVIFKTIGSNIEPRDAAASTILAFDVLRLLASPSDVLAKSPCAVLVCFNIIA